MKFLLICPTNPSFMPYLDNYLKILETNECEYKLLIWDRFSKENYDPTYIYRRGGCKHQRKGLDYYFFGAFIKDHLKFNNYDKVICFGLQTSFFLKRVLRKNYANNYIIDVRDYNPIVRLCNFNSLVEHASFTTISSAGYLSWLPKRGRYLVNHNFNANNISGMHSSNIMKEDVITVSSIGALRDLKVNLELIESVKNNNDLKLCFHGQGDINSKLEGITNGLFSNIEITGYYPKEEECYLYSATNLVNVLRYPDGINNKTALPNRLYLAPYFGRPLLAYKGTYLTEVIEKYNLGLVVNSFREFPTIVLDYLESFDPIAFDISRQEFLNNIIQENKLFEHELNDFLQTN